MGRWQRGTDWRLGTKVATSESCWSIFLLGNDKKICNWNVIYNISQIIVQVKEDAMDTHGIKRQQQNHVGGNGTWLVGIVNNLLTASINQVEVLVIV